MAFHESAGARRAELVCSDMFACLTLCSDFHMHSCCSDGVLSPISGKAVFLRAVFTDLFTCFSGCPLRKSWRQMHLVD